MSCSCVKSQPTGCAQGYQYAVKVVSGVSPREQPPVAPGTYFTAINIHRARVPAHCVSVCEDLELKLHTGTADWKLITADGASLAQTLSPIHPLWVTRPPAGSRWVGAITTDGKQAPANGVPRTYELAFNLCYGFVATQFALQLLADDSAVVYLNGTALAPPAASFTTVTNVPVPNNLLRSGENTLRVVLTNTGQGGNGFALAAH